MTREFELATCGFELVTRRFELVTHISELVTRVLLFHSNSIKVSIDKYHLEVSGYKYKEELAEKE